MKITGLRLNGLENPLGYQYDTLLASWSVEDTASVRAVDAAVEVAFSPDFSDIVYRAEGADLCAAGHMLDIPLTPRTTYHWRVCVTGDAGDAAVSETQRFETGKRGEPWQAEFIAAGQALGCHPVFVKRFTVRKTPRRARLYVSAAGLFEACLNGEKLGQEYLAPFTSDYEKEIQAVALDLDGLLADGENTLEILVGKGWFSGVFFMEPRADIYGDTMACIAELRLEYEDGTADVVGTGEDWACRGSDIVDSGIYDGEEIDRLLWQGRENAPLPVRVVGPADGFGLRNVSKDHLVDRYSVPVLAQESLPVAEVIATPAGETVLDFGQNLAGWVEADLDLPAGTTVTLEYGEILQQGSFYNGNYRDAKARFVYTSAGVAEHVRPHFTYYGFRYVRVTGWPGALDPGRFVARAVYSALRATGALQTSHAGVNRLYQNTVWGMRGNFVDIPTDCPQRSERLGWTADAQVFAPTACYHADTRAFYHKYLHDLRVEQLALGGGIPNFIPNPEHRDDVSSVWGDAATLLPWTLYGMYGSAQELGVHYPMMRDWVDYVTRLNAENENPRLWQAGGHFGDWLALDGATPTSFTGGTDKCYIASCYYYRSAKIVAEAAGVLGLAKDAERFAGLAAGIRAAVLDEYFTPNGLLAADTQAGFVVALKFGLYRSREKLVAQFKRRMKQDCYEIKCGFVGAPLLCGVLAENGMTELAYDLLLREEFPGWLYAVKLGATTVWERWNSVQADGTISPTGMNSLNHYAYGSVMEFAYRYMAGLRPAAPGFARAVIAPRPDVRIPRVSCRYHSASGEYAVEYELLEDGQIRLVAEVPFGCEAELHLPGMDTGARVLGAGTHRYCYTPRHSYHRPYGEGTTLGRLAKDEKAVGVLMQYVPAIGGMALGGEKEMSANSLADIRSMHFLPFDADELEKAIEEITLLRV